MVFEVYRQTLLGDCLVEALEELMEESKITEEVARNVCRQFDATMLDALRNHVSGRAVIKADLKTYRYFDGIWQFNLRQVSFKLSPSGTGSMAGVPEIKCEKAKIVAVDAALVVDDDAPEPQAAGS